MDFADYYEEVVGKIVGHMYYAEASLLNRLGQAVPKGGRMIEIGCDLGRSTTIWAKCARENGFRLDVVDLFLMSYASPDIFLANMSNAGYENGEDYFLNIKDSLEAHKDYADNSIDLLFHDGDHVNPGFAQDLDLWLPKVKPGGVVAFHDYNGGSFPDIKQEVEKRTSDWEIVEAVDSIIAKRKPNG